MLNNVFNSYATVISSPKTVPYEPRKACTFREVGRGYPVAVTDSTWQLRGLRSSCGRSKEVHTILFRVCLISFSLLYMYDLLKKRTDL